MSSYSFTKSKLMGFALVLVASSATAQDTVVVTADNPPVWGDNPRVVEELRIGTLGGTGGVGECRSTL